MANGSQSSGFSVRVLGGAALVALVLAGGAAGFTRVWNFDVHTHLACGQWMIQNRAVLDHDPFSTPDQDQWVNVHWAFQLLVAAAHAVGGFAALTVLKSLLAAAMLAILVVALRREVPAAWLVLCGGLALWIVLGRIRMRPEAVTLVLLTSTLVLVDSVRRGRAARRLWALAPIMLLWANLHGLFVLGMVVFWSALGGAWFDAKVLKRPAGPLTSAEALLAMLTATAVCLLTPWPVQSFLHPFLLWTRVSGQEVFYSYAVSELQPTWQVLSTQPVAIAGFVLTAAVMLVNRRRVPASHVVWLVLFTALGLTALRNVGLTGPVYGFLLAWHGGDLWTRFEQHRPNAYRLRAPAALLMMLIALAAVGGFATEWSFHATHSSRRFGAGRQADIYPLDTAAYLASEKAEGDVFCLNFGDASTFLYSFYRRAITDAPAGQPALVPVRRVWMDGRLEAHSYQRFKQYHALISQDLTSAEKLNSPRVAMDLPPGVRFYFVSYAGTSQLSAFNQSRRFRLVHLDQAGACFARSDWSRGGPTLPPTSNLPEFDRPLTDSGAITGMPAQRRTLINQNARPLIYRTGAMLMWLGRPADGSLPTPPTVTQQRCSLLGVRYLSAADEDEQLATPEVRIGMLAQAHQQFAVQCPTPTSRLLPADVHMARALRLYARLDMAEMTPFDMAQFATQHIAALRDARQYDRAYDAVEKLLTLLPDRLQVTPPTWFRTMSDGARRRLEMAESDLAQLNLVGKSLVEQAQAMSTRAGLVGRAISTLQGAPADDAPAQKLLGDLLLQSGQPEQARSAYTRAMRNDTLVASGGMHLRLILCDWVQGDRTHAREKLTALEKIDPDPAVRYYHALLLEQAGHYDRALDIIDRAKSDDPALGDAIRILHARLLEY